MWWWALATAWAVQCPGDRPLEGELGRCDGQPALDAQVCWVCVQGYDYVCEQDDDGDGDLNACDCDPFDPDVFHGGEQHNDGRDGDCDGELSPVFDCRKRNAASAGWLALSLLLLTLPRRR
jgi:hypothetical protein